MGMLSTCYLQGRPVLFLRGGVFDIDFSTALAETSSCTQIPCACGARVGTELTHIGTSKIEAKANLLHACSVATVCCPLSTATKFTPMVNLVAIVSHPEANTVYTFVSCESLTTWQQ